jgi:hypothetical protein
MGFYAAKIWSAGQPPNFSDLYAPWWGAHELFLHGRNPYTPAVAHEIQTVIYGVPQYGVPQSGAPPTAGRGGPSELAGGFAYPLYAAFLLWPTVYFPFATVQIVFLWVSIFATVGSLRLWLRALDFRVPPFQFLTLALFTLGSFPALQGIRLQNLSVIAAALLAAAIFLLSTGHLKLAGIFLAASTLKPQFTILLIPWLALWIAAEWRRRQSLAWSFAASMLLLIASSEWLQPGWIGQFAGMVRAYRQYTFGQSLVDVWLSPRIGPYAAAALILAVLALSWQYRQHPAGSPAVSISFSMTLAATLVVIPTLSPHAQLLLLPGFLCLFRYNGLLWASRGFARLTLLGAWLLLAWPWIAAMGLTAAALFLPNSALLRWWELLLYPSPILPLAVLVALCFLIRVKDWPSEATA